MDARLDIETIGGSAGFSSVSHLGDHRTVECRLEVRVVEHDEGRVAAELHRAADDRLGGFGK